MAKRTRKLRVLLATQAVSPPRRVRPSPMLAWLAARGHRVTVLEHARRRWCASSLLAALRLLLGAWAGAYDLMHCDTPDPPFAYLGSARALGLVRVPVTLWLDRGPELPQLRLRARLRRADAIFSDDPEVVRRTLAAGILPERVHRIGSPAGAPPPGGSHILVTVLAPLVPGRRLELVLRAFARATRSGGPWQLCILGSGPRGGDLRGLAATLDLGRRTHFAGAEPLVVRWVLDNTAVGIALATPHCFPLSAAMFRERGIPSLVVTATGAPDDRIGSEGAVTVAASETRLAPELAGLLDSGELRARLSREALSSYERLRWQAAASRVEAVLIGLREQATTETEEEVA